jgi:energy-coupling factor transport system ATP-binding protein
LGETVGQELQLRGLNLEKFSWPIESNLSNLSQGEATLFAIEMSLAANSKFLLLDEPFNGLDKIQRERLMQRLIFAAEKSLVIVTGPTAEFAKGLALRVVQISATGITDGEYIYRKELATGNYPAPMPEFALTKEDIHVEVPGKVLLSGGQLSLLKGSLNSLQGANGAGKTSLLEHLVADDAYLVPENFAELFLSDSLDAELELSDKLAGCKQGLSKATFFSLLAGALNQNSDQMLATHPRDLSFATSFALALAIQIVRKPSVLLIDEPGKGFDPLAKQASCEALKCVTETGTAVLFATHDEEFARIAHHNFEIRDSKLWEVTRESVAN